MRNIDIGQAFRRETKNQGKTKNLVEENQSSASVENGKGYKEEQEGLLTSVLAAKEHIFLWLPCCSAGQGVY